MHHLVPSPVWTPLTEQGLLFVAQLGRAQRAVSRIPATISFVHRTPCLEQSDPLEALLIQTAQNLLCLRGSELRSTGYLQINSAQSFLQAATASPVKHHSSLGNWEQPLACLSANPAGWPLLISEYLQALKTVFFLYSIFSCPPVQPIRSYGSYF